MDNKWLTHEYHYAPFLLCPFRCWHSFRIALPKSDSLILCVCAKVGGPHHFVFFFLIWLVLIACNIYGICVVSCAWNWWRNASYHYSTPLPHPTLIHHLSSLWLYYYRSSKIFDCFSNDSIIYHFENYNVQFTGRPQTNSSDKDADQFNYIGVLAPQSIVTKQTKRSITVTATHSSA